jgi:hypothetical protein
MQADLIAYLVIVLAAASLLKRLSRIAADYSAQPIEMAANQKSSLTR